MSHSQEFASSPNQAPASHFVVVAVVIFSAAADGQLASLRREVARDAEAVSPASGGLCGVNTNGCAGGRSAQLENSSDAI